MRIKTLFIALIATAVLVLAAVAIASTQFNVSATTTRASVTKWNWLNSNMTISLNYSAKGTVAFNVFGLNPDGTVNNNLNGLCSTTTSIGNITYICTNVPAGEYEAMIWPDKGTLNGVLTIS